MKKAQKKSIVLVAFLAISTMLVTSVRLDAEWHFKYFSATGWGGNPGATGKYQGQDETVIDGVRVIAFRCEPDPSVPCYRISGNWVEVWYTTMPTGGGGDIYMVYENP